MAELTLNNSGYETGDIDTARALVNGFDEKRAEHINGPASAIVQLETVLGLGPDLRGTLVDLVTRLAIAINANGTLKLATPGASAGTGWLDGQVMIGNSATGGAVPTAIQNRNGLDQTPGNGSLILDTHLSMQVFTSSGSFTVPPGVTTILVRIWGSSGGTGGGGSGNVDGGGDGGHGGLGAPGTYAEGLFTVTAGTNYTVSIGAGGTAGVGGGIPVSTPTNPGVIGTTGGTGITTSFDTLMTCAGGPGGAGGGAGLAGAGGPAVPGADYTTFGATTGAQITLPGLGQHEVRTVGAGSAGASGLAGGAGTAGRPGLVAVSY
jgi:hypothetical protein